VQHLTRPLGRAHSKQPFSVVEHLHLHRYSLNGAGGRTTPMSQAWWQATCC